LILKDKALTNIVDIWFKWHRTDVISFVCKKTYCCDC
jgi:hypothetical protein